MPKTTPFSNSYSSFAELTGKLHQFHELSLALYEHNIIFFFTSADVLCFHRVGTVNATAQGGPLFKEKRCGKFLLLFFLRGQQNTPTPKNPPPPPADGVSTSLLHPPLPSPAL